MCHCEQTCVIAINVDKTNKKQLIIIDQTKIVNLRIFSSEVLLIVKSIILSNNRGGVFCAFCDLVYELEFAPIGQRKERGGKEEGDRRTSKNQMWDGRRRRRRRIAVRLSAPGFARAC